MNKNRKRIENEQTYLAPTRLASPNMFSVPITFVFIVCQVLWQGQWISENKNEMTSRWFTDATDEDTVSIYLF